MNMFRTLRADEIDCRIAQVKKTQEGGGVSLLLYKDARCDQNILDETVGPMNWERKHSRDNANCTVSIWCEERQCWVSKEDTGTESNTEKEKGLASDSFKRACFNWGIGRELYTAPFVWITNKDCNIVDRNGKPQCFDRFTVHDIDYKDGVICYLRIKNQKTGKICYTFGQPNSIPQEKPEQPDTEPEEAPKPVAKAEVTFADKVPPVNPVKVFIRKQLGYMQKDFGITDAEMMKKRFLVMRSELIEKGVIPDKDSDHQTLDEARQMFEAMYQHYGPKK